MAPKPAPILAPDDDRSEFLAAVDEGLADAKAGRTVSYEKVRRWLLSWGSDKELSPPRCP
jgi:predicted transcriptional regulator